MHIVQRVQLLTAVQTACYTRAGVHAVPEVGGQPNTCSFVLRFVPFFSLVHYVAAAVREAVSLFIVRCARVKFIGFDDSPTNKICFNLKSSVRSLVFVRTESYIMYE